MPTASSVDDPPDSAKILCTFPFSRASPLPLKRRTSVPGKRSLDVYAQRGHSVSPRSTSSSVFTDAMTPKLGRSPSFSDSLPGSPSSFTSSLSNASVRRGDLADAEDDFDLELPAVREVDEVDAADQSMASLTLTPQDAPSVAPAEPTPRKTSIPSPLKAESRSTPGTASENTEQGTKPLRPSHSFKRSASAGPNVCTDQRSSWPEGLVTGIPTHEWGAQFADLPPPQPFVTPQDTVPAVPSPLSLSIQPGDVSSEVGKSGSAPTPDCAVSPKSKKGLLSSLSNCSLSKHKPPKSALIRRRSSLRGRTRESSRHSVRFSTKPPQEQRTHSPSVYDRKALPVHHKLDKEDLRELRDLHMPVDLLASRWSSLRLPSFGKMDLCGDMPLHSAHSALHGPPSPRGSSHSNVPHSTGTWTPPGSTTPTAPSPCCGGVAPTSKCDPLADLRAMQERRYRREHGGSFNLGFGSTDSLPSSNSTLASTLAARFGLNKPPPPLPGMEAGASRPTSSLYQRAHSESSLPKSASAAIPDRIVPSPIVRSASPALSTASGYESPAMDIAASGSEYDML